tara:strand:+ start:1647 stop:1943 length:297 start_codon:yes stop_codon:yes gene_type:complete
MDKRKNNGGNSTKALGIDKRKSPYKALVTQATTEEDFIAVFQKLQQNALKGDTQATKLYLEYTIGKPTLAVDITSEGNSITIPTINFTSAQDIEHEEI